MSPKKLNAVDLKGASIKLILNDKSVKIGSIAGYLDNRDDFNENNILFCSYEKQEALTKFVEANKNATETELKRFLEVIKYSDILDYEKLENDVSIIELQNEKPVPARMQVRIEHSGKPGFVRIKYQPPNHTKMFDLGEIQIKNSKITLPVILTFLNYAKENRKKVEKIVNMLHDHGILTWYDKRELIPGDEWEAKIKKAIEKSDYVFIFLSSKTIDREGYKNKEIRYAIEQAMLKPFGKDILFLFY